MHKQKKSYWAVLNLALIALIVGINLYVFAAPLLPQIDLWMRKRATKDVAGLPYKTQLDTSSKASTKRSTIPTDNRLVIPKLALNEHIYIGDNPYLVNLGVWARPKTSIPPLGSNTVLVGHRFNYSAPSTFYSLDKLTFNDLIIVYWQGKEFDYRVVSSRVVLPTAVEIEKPTQQAQLTMYTCTPMWTAKYRLVVSAVRIDQGGQSHE